MTKTCSKLGCPNPRMISKTGKTLTMCQQHQREYWASRKTTDKPSYKAARAAAANKPKGERKGKGGRKKEPAAAAAPSATDNHTLAQLALNDDPIKLVLIDPTNGEIWRVTAVREQLSADADRLNQHTLPILKRAGYRVVNIKDR